MHIASIWNPKGGQGKSLLALNLAAAATDIGLKSTVIDNDPQGTSLLYQTEGGHLPFPVLPGIPEHAPDADLVLIDHSAHDWEIPQASVLVLPVIPKRSQYAAYLLAVRMAKDHGKRIITVVTNGDMRREHERDAVIQLRQQGAFVVQASGVFGRADSDYRTIFDPVLNSAYGVRDRRIELAAILAAVLQNQED